MNEDDDVDTWYTGKVFEHKLHSSLSSKEKFWRTKHGDDTVIFLYVHSLMCMQVKECASFPHKLLAEVKWQFL